MASTPINQRVQKHRARLRKAGFRPVQMWLPDTRSPAYLVECRRQSLLAAQSPAEADVEGFLEAALADLHGWTA